VSLRLETAIAGLAWLLVALPALGDQDWDEREAQAVRSRYVAIQHLAISAGQSGL
jgi:hypothetical protein